MISLRQHIFSLVAVFVALAIGIAAGSTVVRGPLLDSTRARLEAAEQNIELERAENDALAAELGQLDDWAVVGPAQLLSGRAVGIGVLLVTMPDVDEELARGIVGALRASDATLLADIRVDSRLADPTRSSEVGAATALLGGSVPDGDTVDAAEIAAGFATALGARVGEFAVTVAAAGGRVDEALRDVLGATEDSGSIDLVDVQAAAVEIEGVVVVVLNDRTTEVQDGVLDLADASVAVASSARAAIADDRGVAVTVAEAGRVSPTIEQPRRSTVEIVRGDGRLRDEVGTVDNVESALGWIALVLSFEEVGVGGVGHYGFRDGADAALPPPRP
jgi:hypothetical protein